MERGSAQHGSRLDEELARIAQPLVRGAPVPARERADLDAEAPTSDEVDELTHHELRDVEPDPDAPVTMLDHDLVLDRSELARWCLPSAFPGDGRAVLASAREQHAPDHVLAMLDRLDPDRRFEAFGEVWLALGEPNEHRPVDRPGPGAPEADVSRATEGVTAVAPEPRAARHDERPPDDPVLVAPPASGTGPGPEESAPESLLSFGVHLATYPVRLTFAVVREVVDLGRRVIMRR